MLNLGRLLEVQVQLLSQWLNIQLWSPGMRGRLEMCLGESSAYG